MAANQIEVFVAGCPLCEEAVQTVQALACPSCEVTVYDLQTGCATGECLDKARGYGITRVPAVVVNGQVADCCRQGRVDESTLRAMGVGAG